MSDEDLEKSTWNSLHQRKHHIVCSRKKLSLTLKMEKNYEQTTRIDKNDKVSSIVQQLRDSRDSYLRH